MRPRCMFTADETVTWSLGESADKDKFVIDRNGALSFAEAPDLRLHQSKVVMLIAL